MQMLSAGELESQIVIDLPDRELLWGTDHGLLTISGNTLDISVLENLLNGSFNNWSINILDGNHLTVNINDNVSQNDLDLFCNQVIVVLSAQCNGTLVGGGVDP